MANFSRPEFQTRVDLSSKLQTISPCSLLYACRSSPNSLQPDLSKVKLFNISEQIVFDFMKSYKT